MNHRYWFLGLSLFLACFGMLLFALSTPAQAATPTIPGGVFTVNDASDNVTVDSVLTFREALALSQGGTGASGLNRALTNGEKAQATGSCAFTGSSAGIGSWTINASSCGANANDWIYFSVPTNSVIVLDKILPTIQDPGMTIIDGGVANILIDASLLINTLAVQITSNNNTIQNIGIGGASGLANVYVTGNNNAFSNVWVWNATNDGFYISGDNNLITSSRIGVFINLFVTCSTGAANKGNGHYGVYLTNGASNNIISNNYIGCNGSSGIVVDPSAGTNTTIGPNNIIGSNIYHTGDLGNGGSGVVLQTNYNTVMSNTIGFDFHGIYITSTANIIRGNTIISNSVNGINLYNAAAQYNIIGCQDALCANAAPNQISGNGNYGISMNNTYSNTIAANEIGASTLHVSAAGNTSGGIWISGGGYNIVGDSANLLRNTINSNKAFGVKLEGATHNNWISFNDIFSNSQDGVLLSSANSNHVSNNDVELNHFNGVHVVGGFGNYIGLYYLIADTSIIDRNWIDGVLVEGGADNTRVTNSYIGKYGTGNSGYGVQIQGGATNTTVFNCLIESNGIDGIFVNGSTTYNTHIERNHIAYNTSNGIELWNGTHDTHVGDGTSFGENYIFANNHNGILVFLGSNNNLIDLNTIYLNSQNGIELSDLNTTNNVISGTIIYGNTWDAINERNSAAQNSWTHISTYLDGGMGIDKFATSDTSNTSNSPVPTITSVTKNGGTIWVGGKASPSVFGGNSVQVELYSMNINAAGFAEGKTFLGSAYTQLGTGLWSISYLASATGCYVAFQTITDNSGHSTSSEFSPNSCRVFLPLIVR